MASSAENYQDHLQAGDCRRCTLMISPNVDDSVIWGLDATQSFLAIRSDVEVEADRSAFFSKDSVADRAIMRIGFALSNPGGVVRIAADLAEGEE